MTGESVEESTTKQIGNDEYVIPKHDISHPFAWQNLWEATSTNHTLNRFRKACTYIENKCVEVCGLKVYGSPISTQTGGLFHINLSEDTLNKEPNPYVDIQSIPSGIDILVTHAPSVASDKEDGVPELEKEVPTSIQMNPH